MNYDEDIASTVLIHVFNIFEHEGKKYYADVRGITDNLKDIIAEFDYTESIVDTVGYTNKKTKIILKRLGLSTEVSNDMYELINTYKSYYQIL